MARVLIGTDGSEIAERAAARAIDVLGPAVEEVTIVQVVRSSAPVATVDGIGTSAVFVDEDLIAQSREAMIDEAETELRRLLAQLGVPGSTRVTVGDPGAELCRLAGEGGYDLLVVGSHGSGFLRRVLLGSVSHYVLHHARCPVLVVRAGCDGSES